MDFDGLPSEVTSADISIAREYPCSDFLSRYFVPSGRTQPLYSRGAFSRDEMESGRGSGTYRYSDPILGSSFISFGLGHVLPAFET